MSLSFDYQKDIILKLEIFGSLDNYSQNGYMPLKADILERGVSNCSHEGVCLFLKIPYVQGSFIDS
jgi:hypothetical protein